MSSESTPAPALVLAVVHLVPALDPAPALATLAATRRVLVRSPSWTTVPVPPGVEIATDPGDDRAAIAARVRRCSDELVVVLLDDERLSPELAATLVALSERKAASGTYSAMRRVRFLGRDIASGAVTLAWGRTDSATPSPLPLPGTVLTVAASVTAAIDRLEALATRESRAVPVGWTDFVRRPWTDVARRFWLRRHEGIPGLILSILETYGEMLRAAQAWERQSVAARRTEREHGVPPGFHLWRTPMGSLTLRDGTPAVLREALLDATPDLVAGMPLAGGRGAVWAVSLGNNERGVLRWYRRGGAIRHLIRDRYFGRMPRPIRELALTEAVIQRGVPAAQVLAARVDRLPCGWYRGAIVTREVTKATTFAEALCRYPEGGGRTAVLTAVGRAVRELHDRGVYHRDLNAGNVLVGGDADAPQVSFVDFDRAVIRSLVRRRIRERELRRLERSLTKLARAGMLLRSDDALVLRAAYLGKREPG